MLRYLAILSLLLLLAACGHDTPLEPENGYRVTTDRSIYAVGEEIKWVLTNETAESAWILTCPGFTFERYEVNRWTTASEYLPSCVAVYMPIELEAGKSFSSNLLGQTVASGVYRVGAEVFESEHDRGFTVVYSQPFIVR